MRGSRDPAHIPRARPRATGGTVQATPPARVLRKPLLTHAVQGTNHRCLLYSSYVLHLATSKGAEGSTCFIFELLLKKSNYLHQFLTLFFFPWLCMPGLTVRAKICLLRVSNIFPS